MFFSFPTRWNSSEGTLKKGHIVWLGAVVALVAIAGSGALIPKSASAVHTSTKVCTQTAVNTLTCNLSINNIAGFPASEAMAVAVTGPATLTGAVRVSGCAGATVTGVGGGGFTVTTPAAGCAGDTEIVISETLTQTGAIPGGGALVQTITGPTIGTSGPITATAPGGGALVAPFAVATPTGVAKACTGP